MPRNAEQKTKLLVLYDLLCRRTDEEHHLFPEELIALLADKGIFVGGAVFTALPDGFFVCKQSSFPFSGRTLNI